MIFAEPVYDGHYDSCHEELGRLLAAHFPQLRSGLQSDSWLWIGEGRELVAIDTFTALRQQVKAARPGPMCSGYWRWAITVLTTRRQRARPLTARPRSPGKWPIPSSSPA